MAAAPKSSKLGAAFIVLALVVLAYAVILNLNLLSWPIGTELGSGPGTSEVKTQTVQPGILAVSLQGVREEGANANAASGALPNEFPFANVSLSIVDLVTPKAPVVGYTDSAGQFRVFLPQSSYVVRIRDNRFQELNVTVQLTPGSVTNLNAMVNETDFPAKSFNFLELDYSNWIGPWDQLYVYLNTSAGLPHGSGVSSYLFPEYYGENLNSSVGTFPSCTLLGGNYTCPNTLLDPAKLVSSSVFSDSVYGAAQWVGLKASGQFPDHGIKMLTLVTQRISYSVIISES